MNSRLEVSNIATNSSYTYLTRLEEKLLVYIRLQWTVDMTVSDISKRVFDVVAQW